MNVPASGGVNLARSAGLVNFLDVDERWGKTPNQVLIETGVFEAVHTLGRYHDVHGNPMHLDVENFSGGTDIYLDDIPRLDPPVRLQSPDAFCDADPISDKLPCGVSGLMLPLSNTTGQHGFDFPGEWVEKGRKRCESECETAPSEEVTDPCGCEDLAIFDVGTFVFETLGRYLSSGGTVWNVELCNALSTCEGAPPFLDWRDDPSGDQYDMSALR
jgi:hypothetical protein